jgi:hypothetical protein
MDLWRERVNKLIDMMCTTIIKIQAKNKPLIY